MKSGLTQPVPVLDVGQGSVTHVCVSLLHTISKLFYIFFKVSRINAELAALIDRLCFNYDWMVSIACIEH